MKVRCICRMDNKSSPQQLLVCIKCGIQQHQVCMFGSVKASDYDVIHAVLDYQCERCDPRNKNHRRISTDKRCRAMQRTGRFEAQIINQCAGLMWRTYCKFAQNKQYRDPDCPPTLLEATKVLQESKPVKVEPVGFLEGWEDGIKTVLMKCEDQEVEELYRRLDVVDSWKAVSTLGELLKEVYRLQQAGEISREVEELGVLAEILGVKKIGTLWNGL